MVKEGIHPNYGKAVVTCACGNTFETGLINVTVKKAKQLNNSRQAVGRAAMLCSICL